MTALEHFRSKVASSLDMGDAGKYVVLTLAEATELLAEIDKRPASAPPYEGEDEHAH